MDQTFDGVLECIIVDDCGSDSSMDIAEQMVAAYAGPIQFNILHHDHNRGLSAARNTGIRAAKGDWLYFLDSDDYITPECIATLMGFVKKHPDIELVQGSALTTGDAPDSIKRWLDVSSASLPEYINDTGTIQKTLLGRILPPMSWNKLVKREFVLTHDLFFMEEVFHEDEHWNFYLCKHLKAMTISTDATYVYRKREGSITGKSNECHHYESLIKIFADIIPNIEGKYKKYQLRFAFSFLFVLYSNSTDLCIIGMSKELIRRLVPKVNFFSRVVMIMILFLPRRIVLLRLINWNLIQVRIAKHIS